MEDTPVDCNSVHLLVTALNINYNFEGCRLFLDSSMLNLKAVLLHNGNALQSVTV